MTPPHRWRLALSIQASLSHTSWVGVRLMVGYRTIALDDSPFLLAVLAASFAAPSILLALPAGRLSDRVGGSVIASAGLIVVAAGTALVAFSPLELAVLLPGALVIGLGQLCVMVGQQTFVAHSTRTGSVDSGFGTLTAAASIGQLIGPLVVTSAATFGGGTCPDTTTGLMVCLGFTLLAFPLVVVLRRGDARRRSSASHTTRTPVCAVLRAPELWPALTASGAVLVTVDLLYTFVPLWAVAGNIPVAAVGFLLALRALVSVVSRFGLERLVNRFGRKRLLVGSMVIGIVCMGVFPLVSVLAAIPVMVGLGIALGIPQPLTMAWTTAITPASAHGAALGLRLTANRLAQVALPLIVGAVAGPFGLIAVFWSNALVLGLGATVVATSSTSDRSENGDQPGV